MEKEENKPPVSVFAKWPEGLNIRREWSFDEIMKVSLSNPNEVALPANPEEAVQRWHEWLQWMEFQAFRQQGRRWGTKTHQACMEAIQQYEDWKARQESMQINKNNAKKWGP